MRSWHWVEFPFFTFYVSCLQLFIKSQDAKDLAKITIFESHRNSSVALDGIKLWNFNQNRVLVAEFPMSNDCWSGLVCLSQFHISFLLGVIGGSALVWWHQYSLWIWEGGTFHIPLSETKIYFLEKFRKEFL